MGFVFIYMPLSKRREVKMSEQVQRKGKKMRNTFEYTGVLQNFTHDLIDRKT
jgi:hypothetical protein